ncbi:Aminoacyl-tRNA synthetase class Ia [Arabidopsis thaliana x Arabidopsis arenosa]|uniref:isoleucine--tRNA ligase n=1 Tax=Arabidopsis thaliana x Arabidopsis arenosa TaxID=1240361 RepID=A0A8T2AUL6_9BRAS|nr:Aminoacyl-tRNA synthetase class Ia [Arabidopsis thaliana x Arabidopsis arenosa]
MEDVCEGKDFSFPREEKKVLSFWTQIDAFKNQLKLTENCKEYVFYDGPPFATGLPHYGHILAGTIKDIVTRYQTMNGKHVTRRFGWDCHGLPVENEIDRKLNIKRRDQVLEMGIDKYNEQCRSIVTRYVEEWEKIITRTGRWIDFSNDYKTMDLSFMESVWWGFAQLFDKNLVYRGFKVWSFFLSELLLAGQNYKDVVDPEIMVTFPVIDDQDNAAFVAWTTTPWTLPSNLALCVNAKFVYLKVRNNYTGKVYVVAESRLSSLPIDKPKAETAGDTKKVKGAKPDNEEDSYQVLEKFNGASLVGKKYEPLFDYFSDFSSVAFRVVADDYVTNDSGTGIVHCAPAFGEDDYRVCLENKIINKGDNLVVAVDDDGLFTERITHFSGLYVKDADKDIIKAVKAKGRLVKSGSFTHSYPFCWRSDTPLIYRAVPSWFVRVEQLKEKLLENNDKTKWVPKYVKDKRFHNWLENARDWAVSRSRFWGTPLPIWISDDGEEVVVMDSVEKLEKLSGVKVFDLHRHHIDQITIPSSRGHEFGVLRRVEDVFDCWFESGSMPYAYIHYPFENKELFEKNFPGDFVAEGLDQTRGWFYTLMVLSTALFDKPAFKYLICNGLVLAEDGKKMSKKLKNYPSPLDVIDEYGADAVRLYLINSPVVRAETLRFKKEGVLGVVKDVFLPWYNAYRFLVQNAKRLEIEICRSFVPSNLSTLQSSNVLDQWIHSATQTLVKDVHDKMDEYRLDTVVPLLLEFLDNLTNIYVRFNRKRLKGRTRKDDCHTALSTLYNVLLTSCKVMTPFTPFFTETLYQNLRKVCEGSEESIHYCSFPQKEEAEVKKMSHQDILRFKETKEVTIANHSLKLTDIKIFRDFKRPDGLKDTEIDAAIDGEVIVILDLREDESLKNEGVAREDSETTKKSCLEPTDFVEVYFESLDMDDYVVQRVLCSQEQYIKEKIGSPLLHSTLMPPDVFGTLARPALKFKEEAILALYSGDVKFATRLRTYLLSRDHSNLKSEFKAEDGKITVSCIEKIPVVTVVLGEHMHLTVGD